jgi:hypothetical protein
MIDKNKAVFLPIDNRILSLYKGYILNGAPLLNVNESDFYTVTEYYEFTGSISKREKITRIISLGSLFPIFVLIFLIATIFKKSDHIKYLLDSFFNIFFKRKKELRTKRIKKKKYNNAIEEDIPEFLNHCNMNFVKVYLYSYSNLTKDENAKVENLISSGFISACQIITKLSDLNQIILSENISILNSILIIKEKSEANEANILVCQNGGSIRNIELWKKRNLNGKESIEWNSNETIIGMKKKIDYYLYAKNKSFFTNDFIIFIEDKYDEFLNIYIQNNLVEINNRLEQKGLCLIYFPAFQNDNVGFQEPILQFIRYRLPTLYSLSDTELNEAIKAVLEKITPLVFYRLILEEIDLPFFERPCLLRNISNTRNGFVLDENMFTHFPIKYETKEDLDILFDFYINQVKIQNGFVRFSKVSPPGQVRILKHKRNGFARFSKVSPPLEYDADWHFGSESKKDTKELMQKIDSIKEEGKYGVMVEAIMYMLATIKEEKPEILSKIKPLLEKKKMLESKVVLSPILIDKHYKILLPDFGNIEVKMHALPKTVYILFLRYPQGIRFKELYQHKAELLEIYNKVTNKYEKEEIEKAITDLVDMTNPSINQKCARIREAFRNLMDENIARYYYIDGTNGEPKKISLPENLIDIRY